MLNRKGGKTSLYADGNEVFWATGTEIQFYKNIKLRSGATIDGVDVQNLEARVTALGG